MSATTMLALQLLAFAYAVVLPGWLLSRGLTGARSGLVRLAVGVALGLLVVPTACFAVAWLARTNIQWPLVLAVGSGLNVAGLLRLWWQRRRAAAPARPRHPGMPS